MNDTLTEPEAQIVFSGWPKTPRLFRDMTITEKIDGTNSAVIITEDGQVGAQSRNRLIYPGKSTDNYGFARWVQGNSAMLIELLGPGHHYGEWWGHKIARAYGLSNGERRFSLFNVNRYAGAPLGIVEGLGVVPTLYEGIFEEGAVRAVVDVLRLSGSRAEPGFMRPEGLIVHHSAANQIFKVTLEWDELPKEAQA